MVNAVIQEKWNKMLLNNHVTYVWKRFILPVAGILFFLLANNPFFQQLTVSAVTG